MSKNLAPLTGFQNDSVIIRKWFYFFAPSCNIRQYCTVTNRGM